MKRICMPLLALLCLNTGTMAQHPYRLQSTDPVTAYADLLPLKASLSSATVIGAGEGTHGSREFFRMKHRLFRFLAEEMGYTVFAMEDSPYGAALIQQYLETGTGNPVAIIREHFHKVYQVQELADLVYWMRKYNLAHDRKLRFTGFDCQQMHYFHQGLTEISSRYALHCFNPLLKYSADTSVSFSQAMIPLIRIADSIAHAFPQKPDSVPAEQWQLARFYLDNIRAASVEFLAQEGDWARSMNTRDSMMASNVQWIREKYKGEKMMLWAHNSHLGNYYADSMIVFKPMGAHLREAFGKQYINIAMLTGSGTYRAQADMRSDPDSGHRIIPPLPGSVDAQLQQFKVPLFLLPLKKANLFGRMRTVGVYASEHQFTLLPVKLQERFDWVLYAETTTSAITL